MSCLPINDPNQFDLFNSNINFAPVPSSAFPPNMAAIMDELAKPDAFAPSVNLTVVDDAITALDAMTGPEIAALPANSQQLIAGTYDFAGDPLFNAFTSNYNIAIPPLISNGDSLRDILSLFRTHIVGIPTTVPGVIGSLGHANILRSFGAISSGNGLQKHLGLGAIPDCGLADGLLDSLLKLLQPLIDLLANLLDPLFNLILAILGILAAILAELLNLLNILQRLLDFATGSQLLSLDPCALLFMGQSGSTTLNNEVNSGIEWVNPDAPQIPTAGQDLPTPPPPRNQ